MDLVYSELYDDGTNERANRIIDAADEYAAGEKTDISIPINSYYVELWLTNEIEAAEEREKSPNLMISIAAGTQKAALRRVLEKVQKWKGQTGLYEV
mgnify:CR=1 FL=1